LRTGGWSLHQVDFRFHSSFDRPLEHLLLSRAEFDCFAAVERHELGTQLRPFELAELFRQQGLEAEFLPCDLAPDEYLQAFLPRLRACAESPYRDTPAEQLRAIGGLFRVHKRS